MADVSLDEYIVKTGKFNNKFGGKAGFQGGSQPQFKVTGLGKVKGNFDARQNLSKPAGRGAGRGVQDARQNLKKPVVGNQGKGMQDARQKIMQKTKFVDARVRIQNKKAQAPVDARQKITAKQTTKPSTIIRTTKAAPMKPPQPKQFMHQAPGGTKVLVTGVGRVLAHGNTSGVMTTPAGTVYKTIQATEPAEPTGVTWEEEGYEQQGWEEEYDETMEDMNWDGQQQQQQSGQMMQSGWGGQQQMAQPMMQTGWGGKQQMAQPLMQQTGWGGQQQMAPPMMQTGWGGQQQMAQPMMQTAWGGQQMTQQTGLRPGGQPGGRKKLLITTTNKRVKPKITPITPPAAEEPEPIPGPVRQAPAAVARVQRMQAVKQSTVIRTTTAPRKLATNIAQRIGPKTVVRQREAPAPRRAIGSAAPARKAVARTELPAARPRTAPAAQRLAAQRPAAQRPALFSRGPGTVVRVRNELYDEEEPVEPEYEDYAEEEPYAEQEEEMEEPEEYTPPLRTRPALPRPAPPLKLASSRRRASPRRSASPVVPVSDTVSPAEGYRVVLSNLHPFVTEDDIVELFGSVGSLKKAHLIKPRVAEITFFKKEEAQAAIRKYHMRELDGQPMHLMMASSYGNLAASPKASTSSTSMPLRLNKPATAAPSQGLSTALEIAAVTAATAAASGKSAGPLRLGKESAPISSEKAKSDLNIDPTLIHKALFKTAAKGETPARPVSFTVKI